MQLFLKVTTSFLLTDQKIQKHENGFLSMTKNRLTQNHTPNKSTINTERPVY